MKNKKKEKKKNNLLPVMAIGIFILLISFLFMSFGGKKSLDEENKMPNPDDPNFGSIKLPFNKNDVLKLIYQTKELQNDVENWTVKDTALIAHTENNSMYLVRYKKITSDGVEEELESIVTIKNEEKVMDLPGWPVGTKTIEDYNFLYYTEDSEGYDPENQQYYTS